MRMNRCSARRLREPPENHVKNSQSIYRGSEGQQGSKTRSIKALGRASKLGLAIGRTGLLVH